MDFSRILGCLYLNAGVLLKIRGAPVTLIVCTSNGNTVYIRKVFTFQGTKIVAVKESLRKRDSVK